MKCFIISYRYLRAIHNMTVCHHIVPYITGQIRSKHYINGRIRRFLMNTLHLEWQVEFIKCLHLLLYRLLTLCIRVIVMTDYEFRKVWENDSMHGIIFSWYYIHSDICCSFISSTALHCTEELSRGSNVITILIQLKGNSFATNDTFEY